MWLHIPNNEIAHLKRSFQGPFTSSHSLFEIGLHLLFVRSANLFSKKALGLLFVWCLKVSFEFVWLHTLIRQDLTT